MADPGLPPSQLFPVRIQPLPAMITSSKNDRSSLFFLCGRHYTECILFFNSLNVRSNSCSILEMRKRVWGVVNSQRMDGRAGLTESESVCFLWLRMLSAGSPAWLGSSGSHPAAGAGGCCRSPLSCPQGWAPLTLFFQEPLKTRARCQPSPCVSGIWGEI